MSTRALFGFSSLPLVLAAIALSAHAQTAVPSSDVQPVAAKDKQVVESAFTKADGNTDGKLSRDEVARLPAIHVKFDELDRDKDGLLSLDEFGTVFTSN